MYTPKWEKVVHKNPKNYNLFLTPRSTAIQINRKELFISSLKCCYIFNTETKEFASSHNFVQEDEFLDGFYLYNEKVFGYGRKGIHVFDTNLKKWNFIDEVTGQ